ncbi:hypothetical protein DFH11DRAFT_145222 [Phellopilus nigrolimitatus]|nr:hypothetical protein DFH11DRAFT_145222 [Phellopilus nigrolimitatus]
MLSTLKDVHREHIFCFLDLPEIYALSALNRFCHTIYEDTPKLRYHSALLKAGMLDGADGRDVVNKLAYLEWKETSWAHFGLERTVHVVVRHRPSAVYELTAGFYLLGDASHTSDMPVFMRQTRALRCFDLTQLWPQDCYIATHRDPWPALTFKGTVAQDEHLVDFGVAIQEFDLIAVVTMTNVEIVSLRLRLMEFSTGRSHPLAASQVLYSIYTAATMGKPSVMVQISGRYLIYLVRWPRTVMEMRIADEVNLFDWWTGAHLVVRNPPFYSRKIH